MLGLMVNGLRAGYSVMQAMEAVSKELPPPISDEFRRVVQEIQIGLPIERAMDNLYRRIPSEDLDLTITALNVQREVGGNLAEILDTISYTIRERVRIKGEIRVLTSQVVYSSRFLSSMPILIAVALWFMNRPYMMMFFNPDSRMIGIPVLIFGGMMIFGGYMVMNKIADIEV
jgi:tight adherence protein B